MVLNKKLIITEADYNYIKNIVDKVQYTCLADLYEKAYKYIFKAQNVEYNYKYNTIVCLVNRIEAGKTYKKALDIYKEMM